MRLTQCEKTGLLIPENHLDSKQALKRTIDKILEDIVMAHQKRRNPYFIVFHAKFNPICPDEFQISAPVLTETLPPFTSNQMVWWVCNRRGICELLWMVPPKVPGQTRLNVQFNQKGVAYLQAKGAMPTKRA